ncbi:MAG: histidine kinase [Bacteroidales bacterium]|nr:histidine kinase [Bacteroidales bacterium]
MKFAYAGFIASVITLCGGRQLSGQGEYPVKYYTSDHGLPNNHVRWITQDRSGFIWIATWDAVSRYDGYEFVNYYHNPEDSLSVPGMNIIRIISDGDDNLWVASPFGFYRFVRERDCFTEFPDIREQFIYDCSVSETGVCQVISDKGIYRYDKNDRRFREIRIFCADSTPGCLSGGYLVSDANGDLWTASYPEFFRYFYKPAETPDNGRYCFNKTLVTDQKFLITNPNFRNYFNVIHEQGNIYLASDMGLFMADTGSCTFKKAAPGDVPSGVSQQDYFWNETERDFYVKTGTTLFHYNKNHSSLIEACMVDTNGTIWLGELNQNSEGMGLTKIVRNSGKFRHYLTSGDLGERTAVLSVLRDSSGTIWVGTIGNLFLYRLNGNGGAEKCVFVNKDNMPASIHSRSLMEYRGKIWAGNSSALLYRFDVDHPEPEYLCPGPFQKILPVGFRTFKIIAQACNGFLMMAGRDGFCLYDPEKDSLILFEKEMIPGDIYAVVNDSDSNYWLGSNYGKLIFFDKSFRGKRVYQIPEKRYNVESIIEDDRGHLWLALLGGGICRFDKETGKSEIYSTQHGLKNSTCYNILMDTHGHLWVSTNQGISMFNPEIKRFRNFGEAEGLKIVEFNADAVWHGDDDEMMFGGMGGFVSFYPDSVENISDSYYSPLLITEFKVSGVSRFPDIYKLKSVKLEKGENNFQIAFACVDFLNADKIFYRYCLPGSDTAWTLTDSRKRFANFLNLRPDVYHFRVQATDASGNWKQEMTLEIEIPAWYYETAWFKTVLVLAGASILAIFVLMYIRHIRARENRKREKMLHEEQVKREQLKLEALRGQLNPHFIFNSLNSVNSFILDNDPLKANQYLTDFSNLMRAFLDHTRNEYIPLIREAELLEHYMKLEQTRFADRFSFTIDYDKVDDIYQEIVPSMVQPFLENAVWHGMGKMKENGRGHINLVFRQDQPDFVTCIVEDNGIGIRNAEAARPAGQKNRQSRGIGIIRERLEILNSSRKKNYTVSIEEISPGSENAGTRVRVEIPCKIADQS